MYRMLLMLAGSVFCLHSLALKPASKYEGIPDTMKLPFEKNTIVTPDGVKLKSWTFLPEKSVDNKTTIVIAYGDAGNMSWWLQQSAVLSSSGFTVVMFDYRGFGESSNFKIDPKMLYYNEFATDLSAVLRFAKKKYHGRKTGVWALSMGTIITTVAARQTSPDFVIGEGFVTDPIKLQSFYAKKNHTVNLPEGAKEYRRRLALFNAPMIIFSGKRDVVTTCEDAENLQKTKPSIKLVTFDGGHMEGFYVLSDGPRPGGVYIGHIKRFLKLG